MKFTPIRFNLAPTLLLCLIAPLQINAQFTQQGGKLVGTGAIGSAIQGRSVALSSDGNTAIVVGSGDNGGVGAAWVWTRTGVTWTQQGNKLVGTGAIGTSRQGSSVALSADGNTAIVGGEGDSSGRGAVWVWTRTGVTWTQQGGKLVGAGAVGTAFQGISVALSPDGNTAIVGGTGDNLYAGAAWVWTRTGVTWTQQGNKLVGTGAVGPADKGSSVALSPDGNIAIVGGIGDNGGVGAVWVWTRTGGTWTQQGNKLVGTGAIGTSRQGSSVALSADGNTTIVGGYVDNNSAGAAWVWTRTGGTWTQQGGKLVGVGAVSGAHQGFSVSLSSDGNTAIVGGDYDNVRAGAVWVWTRSGGTWMQQGDKLVGTGAVGTSYQGTSVALSSDGNTAIIGGQSDNNGAGAVWVYTRPATPILPRELAVHRFIGVNSQSVRFDLPQKSRIVIQLFNSKGQMVSQLLDETRDAGYYTIPLSNEAQGSYYLDFRAGDFHRTMKLER